MLGDDVDGRDKCGHDEVDGWQSRSVSRAQRSTQ
jgi:hypothetical protein